MDLSAILVQIKLSTHDDGEAELTFPNEEQALAFLRSVQLSGAADSGISCVLRNKNRFCHTSFELRQVQRQNGANLAHESCDRLTRKVLAEPMPIDCEQIAYSGFGWAHPKET